MFFVSVQLHFSTVWWYARSAFLISNIYLSFSFFYDRHSAYFFLAISTPSTTTLYPPAIFLYWTRHFGVFIDHVLTSRTIPWDAPINVTFVSLFFSLFFKGTYGCNLLHGIANGVELLREPQQHKKKNFWSEHGLGWSLHGLSGGFFLFSMFSCWGVLDWFSMVFFLPG